MAKNKMKNHNYKQYDIYSLEDALFVLGSLIRGVTFHLIKYKSYSDELEKLVEKYYNFEKENLKEALIPADEYDSIKDKLLFRQHSILPYVSDYQKDSFSYIDLRKWLRTNNYIKSPLSEELNKILNNLLDIRNWSFHNPKYNLVANKEVAIKNIPKELKNSVRVTPMINPVITSLVSEYDTKMLASLYLYTKRRSYEFELILKSMKSDYNEMFQNLAHRPICLDEAFDPNKVCYEEIYRICRYGDPSNDVAQISMAIQKSKYDGTNETYNKWALKKVEADIENEDIKNTDNNEDTFNLSENKAQN